MFGIVLSLSETADRYLADHIYYARPVYAQEAPVMRAIPVYETEDTLVSSSTYCSCVAYARKYVPDLPKGDAEDLKTNLAHPIAGSVVKLLYGDVYHLAVVLSVRETSLDIREYNFRECKETFRTIPIDERIQGYWLPPQLIPHVHQ